MIEKDLILTKGEQPVPTISDEKLDFLISREFPYEKELVRTKLNNIKSDSENAKNRICTSVLKVADKKLDKIDFLVKRANKDFRDIVSEAEYPRAHKSGFALFDQEEKIVRDVLLSDWEEYSTWTEKR